MAAVVSGDMKGRATAFSVPTRSRAAKKLQDPLPTLEAVMPPDGTGTPSGTWDTDSSAGWWDAVLRSTGAVSSSPQAPHQSGCHPLEHGVWTVDSNSIQH